MRKPKTVSLVLLLVPAILMGAAKPPIPIHVVDLRYPEIARTARVAGEVRIKAVVSADGRVSFATVLSGHLMLRDAAMTNVKQWRFEPSPGGAEVYINYQFRLRPETLTGPCTTVEFDLPGRVLVISNPSPVQE